MHARTYTTQANATIHKSMQQSANVHIYVYIYIYTYNRIQTHMKTYQNIQNIYNTKHIQKHIKYINTCNIYTHT